MSAPTIPAAYHPSNAMSAGPNSSVLANTSPSAPGSHSDPNLPDFSAVARQYGTGLAMQLRTELHLLSSPSRLPGLPCTAALRDAITGRDGTIEFDDVLNRKEDRAEAPRVTVHGAMEVKLGL